MAAAMSSAVIKTPRLEVRNISKTYGARTVLSNLNLTVYPGEMHGVVGQNGSGKSTFAKAISGYHAPDKGAEILIDGALMHLPIRPSDLRAAAVSIVHQHLGLIEDSTVVENVRIAAMRGAQWTRRIRWRHEVDAATDALERLGFNGSPRTLVRELPPADRARVAIGRAIQDHTPGRGLIIFDESTRALPADAMDDFYATVRQLLDDGTGVLMIGHNLSEILSHCDRVTILRDGRAVAEGLRTEGLSESDLATLMLGHELHHIDFKRSERHEVQAHVVNVRGLSGAGLSGSLDLEVGLGEIVGITGLPGSGFEAVPYLLSGAAAGAGIIELAGKRIDLASTSVAKLVGQGIVLVPENRPKDGLGLEHTVIENISLPWLSQRGRPWATGRRWQEDEANKVIETLGVVPPNPRQLVARLSGGNAQKVLLGKWLMGAPKLLLLHEPTQGVDVKARLDLLGAVHRVAGSGTSILVASTEPEDLVTICDRVIFFGDGTITEEISYPFDSAQIVKTIYSTVAKQSVATRPASMSETRGETP
jgi:ribose transport system ATP-binding protein